MRPFSSTSPLRAAPADGCPYPSLAEEEAATAAARGSGKRSSSRAKASSSSSKPVLLKDYQRARLLANPEGDEALDDAADGVPRTHAEEQRALKREITAAFHAGSDDDEGEADGDDSEDEDGLFRPREKDDDERLREEREYEKFLETAVGKKAVKQALGDDKEEAFLRRCVPFSSSGRQREELALTLLCFARPQLHHEPRLDRPRERLVARTVLRRDRRQPVGAVGDQEGQGACGRRRGRVRRRRAPPQPGCARRRRCRARRRRRGVRAQVQLPLRGEVRPLSLSISLARGPSADALLPPSSRSGGADLVTHARDAASSVRKPTTAVSARARARDAAKQRKEEEALQRKEELRRLKALKRKEVEEKLKQLAEAAGAGAEGLDEIDLDGEWDEAKHEEAMRKVYGGEYEELDVRPRPLVLVAALVSVC